ncbi:MAG: UDP-N-acetylmuramoyl-tripeptide--D-alanyl-D-alanine ligase [Candidatus Peregrinibacteria bacterium]|nr:UDP-N-acetylmuramoyl-tripeptide--D-alanyl-D-alanine ligase [Candidatus Peregrinibacteria bacterium]
MLRAYYNIFCIFYNSPDQHIPRSIAERGRTLGRIGTSALALGLALFGALSPLLTLASLWQRKEWRWDRLREHFRSEGMLPSLFGKVRPIVFLGSLLFMVIQIVPRDAVVLGGLALFTVLTLVQIVLKRQPMPVLTSKAIAIVLVSFGGAIIAGLLFVRAALPALLILPLLAPFFIVVAWALLRPLDALLKQRIMARAKALRASFTNITVIGITGSVGKTTTKELLAHLLSDQSPLVTPEHVNSEMGVAQWLIGVLSRRNQGDRTILIVEMGAYRSGEIALLCDITAPSIGILTSIGTQHLALFGSPEKLKQAKGELIHALPTDGLAILNADSPPVRDLAESAQCSVILVGTVNEAQLGARSVTETPTGIRMEVDGTAYDIPLHGTHNAVNVLLAMAAAEHLGVTRDRMHTLLATFRPLEKSFTVREERGVTILDATHNASPESFRAAIAWAKQQTQEQKVLITPGIIELGTEEEHVHRELGALASGIFTRAIVLHPSKARWFGEGFGKDVARSMDNATPVSAGSLLMCIGRLPSSFIRQLLPHI